MDSEAEPRSRPRPMLLALAAALALAAGIVVFLTRKVPGRSWTYAQAAQVSAFGHRGAIKVAGDCGNCHR